MRIKHAPREDERPTARTQVWIVKPSNANQGNGIVVCRSRQLEAEGRRLWGPRPSEEGTTQKVLRTFT